MDQFSSFLQQLKERVSLLAEVSSHVKLKRKGRDWWGCCPYHQEKTASFVVNELKRSYHCFGCGAHGDVISFVEDTQSLSFWEAVELLAAKANLPLPDRKSSSSNAQPQEGLYQALEAACTWFQEQLGLVKGEAARRYLQERGVLPESIQTFRLGFAPRRGLLDALKKQGFSEAVLCATGLVGEGERGTLYERFRERLIFPICDRKGQIAAFGGRLLTPGEPKYLNSPEMTTFQKGTMLYAWSQALPHIREGKPPLIVEGYMDVIALHQAGFKGAVAPLGTALTEEQLRQLWHSCDGPILCFDGDVAGRKAAQKAAERALSEIRPGKSLRFCHLPQGEDPDSLIRNFSAQAFDDVIQHPLDLVEVIWKNLLQTYTLNTPEQKAILDVEINRLADSIQDATVKRFYRFELFHRFEKELKRLNFMTSSAVFKKEDSFLKRADSRPLVLEKQENLLGTKILLATLINHPTLVEEVSEQLMVLTIPSLELSALREGLLSWSQERIFQSIPAQNDDKAKEAFPEKIVESLEKNWGLNDLQEKLYDDLCMNGFRKIVEDLQSPVLYLHASFAAPTASMQEAREGWQQVWQHVVGRRLVEGEILEQAQHTRDELNVENWERFKLLKYNLISKN